MPVLTACGTDIEEYSRFGKYFDRNTVDPAPLIRDLFTEDEIHENFSVDAVRAFTAGFAFKEALMKAFSTVYPAQRAGWKEMALLRDTEKAGGYRAVLSGLAAEIHAGCGFPEISIKITFEDEYVTAEILLIRKP